MANPTKIIIESHISIMVVLMFIKHQHNLMYVKEVNLGYGLKFK